MKLLSLWVTLLFVINRITQYAAQLCSVQCRIGHNGSDYLLCSSRYLEPKQTHADHALFQVTQNAWTYISKTKTEASSWNNPPVSISCRWRSWVAARRRRVLPYRRTASPCSRVRNRYLCEPLMDHSAQNKPYRPGTSCPTLCHSTQQVSSDKLSSCSVLDYVGLLKYASLCYTWRLISLRWTVTVVREQGLEDGSYNEQIDCPHNDLHPLQYKHRLFFLNIISLVGSCKGSVLEIHCLVHEWNWPCPARIRYLSKKNEILQTQMLLKF